MLHVTSRMICDELQAVIVKAQCRSSLAMTMDSPTSIFRDNDIQSCLKSLVLIVFEDYEDPASYPRRLTTYPVVIHQPLAMIVVFTPTVSYLPCFLGLYPKIGGADAGKSASAECFGAFRPRWRIRDRRRYDS